MQKTKNWKFYEDEAVTVGNIKVTSIHGRAVGQSERRRYVTALHDAAEYTVDSSVFLKMRSADFNVNASRFPDEPHALVQAGTAAGGVDISATPDVNVKATETIMMQAVTIHTLGTFMNQVQGDRVSVLAQTTVTIEGQMVRLG
ncbi:hypothetical protein [Pandoraea sputorum]|uniref:hypothetical protein n=1 Tax=Pandoraea sputorum TaxID=93222 RepID=UPI001242AF37|nr:hypothetical protein [Pandoraea sputorum]